MENKNDERQQIIQCLNDALAELYLRDVELIEKNIDERAIAFRLGIYLDTSAKKYFCDYALDSEYNRYKEEPKQVFSQCESKCAVRCAWKHIHKRKRARPDFILHKRGYNENMCCIEVKKISKTCNYDRAKLSYMTCTNGSYRYQFGLLLRIGDTETIIELFQDGRFIERSLYTR